MRIKTNTCKICKSILQPGISGKGRTTFIPEFTLKYSDESNRHFIQVLKKWRDL